MSQGRQLHECDAESPCDSSVHCTETSSSVETSIAGVPTELNGTRVFSIGVGFDESVPRRRDRWQSLPESIQQLLTGESGRVAGSGDSAILSHQEVSPDHTSIPGRGIDAFFEQVLIPGFETLAEEENILDKIKKDYPKFRLPTDEESEVIDEALRTWRKRHPPKSPDEQPPIIIVFTDPPMTSPQDAESFSYGTGWVILIAEEYLRRRRKKILSNILFHELKHREDTGDGIDAGADIIDRFVVPGSAVFESFVRHQFIYIDELKELCEDICGYGDDDDKEFACEKYANWAKDTKERLKEASILARVHGQSAKADELDKTADSIPQVCPCCEKK